MIEHLLQLPPVGPDAPDLVRQAELEDWWPRPSDRRSIFSIPTTTSLMSSELRGGELLAGEGEELAGDVRGPGAGPDDLLDLGAAGVVLLQAPEQKLAEPDDAGHHVVDLVRHAAGEPARRLHPLGPAQLLLHPFALGDVPVDPPHHHGPAIPERAAEVPLDGDRQRPRASPGQLDVGQRLSAEHPLDRTSA